MLASAAGGFRQEVPGGRGPPVGVQLLPGAPAPAFRLCVRSAVWLLGTSKSYLYDKSAHTNLSRVQEWEAGRMRGVSIVPCNICRRGGGCQLADGEFRVVDLLQADGICACCDGTALRLGGARCSAKLQRLLRDDRGGLLQQAHDDYHTSHHGYLERGGRRLTQARRLRAVATLLERGLCREAVRKVLNSQAAEQRRHGNAGRCNAKRILDQQREQMVRFVLERVRADPEGKLLQIIDRLICSKRGMYRAAAEHFSRDPAAVTFCRQTFRTVLASHPLTAGFKLVARRKDHNCCPICLDFECRLDLHEMQLKVAKRRAAVEREEDSRQAFAEQAAELQASVDALNDQYNEHEAEVAQGRLFAKTLESVAAEQRLRLSPEERNSSQFYASVPASTLDHQDKMSMLDLPSMWRDPAAKKTGLNKFVTEQHGVADVTGCRGFEYFISKGQNHGGESNIGISIHALHSLTTLNGERTKVLLLDRASDQHSTYWMRYAQLLVDTGLVERSVVAMLPTYHAKHHADRVHGCLRSALGCSNIMNIDGLSRLADSIPNMHGTIANPAQFADFKAYLESNYKGPGREKLLVKSFFLFVASRELDGKLLMKRTPTDQTWYKETLQDDGYNCGIWAAWFACSFMRWLSRMQVEEAAGATAGGPQPARDFATYFRQHAQQAQHEQRQRALARRRPFIAEQRMLYAQLFAQAVAEDSPILEWVQQSNGMGVAAQPGLALRHVGSTDEVDLTGDSEDEQPKKKCGRPPKAPGRRPAKPTPAPTLKRQQPEQPAASPPLPHHMTRRGAAAPL
ncbi:dynactin subunit 4 isoform X1 [Micractinium conductrix]|uniref:Dynactin subunit 4 isoform X1 n=1 Tax=Micractinium conductrix TaxID=554055 RepID=A0A2P6VLP8_9CHLO|nr:dynactin subunit 4 isoform X1 [Micractinium conductrix]|eukprot:PSC75004.1 dynactin subunit 4 isoform X1 [Micractinium conductrix]